MDTSSGGYELNHECATIWTCIKENLPYPIVLYWYNSYDTVYVNSATLRAYTVYCLRNQTNNKFVYCEFGWNPPYIIRRY